MLVKRSSSPNCFAAVATVADETLDKADFPITRFMGMDVHRTGRGTARATATIGETHHNPNGVAHGSVIFAMADTSMGAATMSILDEGSYCSTIEIQIRYLRPVVSGPVVVETQVIKPGRRIVHLESRATDADGRLVATATGSYAVLEIPSA